MSVEKLRVVFDCMIYLQAVLTETGLASSLFDLLDEDAFALFTSPEILNEVQDVLNR